MMTMIHGAHRIFRLALWVARSRPRMLSIPSFAMIVVDQQTAMTDVPLQGFPARNPVILGTLFLPHADMVGAVG